MDRRRSLTLAHFAGFAGMTGVSLVSLQKDAPATQTKSPPAGLVVHDWIDEFGDFADTAALVEALDLVISVDTSVAHLAGALGKPVWLLNRFDTDWRWLLDRDDSPWYPTLRQFRQPGPGEWEPVLSRVHDALAELAAGAQGGTAVNG
jgi:ADP-heptose:LPS heptosyltransferase